MMEEDKGLIQDVIEISFGDSKFLSSLGILALGMGLGVGSCCYLSNTSETELLRLKKQDYNLKSGDVLGKDDLEEFYEINSKKAYLKIDGVLIEDQYKK